MSAELLRRIGNLIAVGTISEVEPSRALVRVALLDRVSDFLPVLMFANSFKKHFIPPRVGEQVVVVSPYGEANSGFVIRGIFNRGCKEPELANETTEVMEFEDGTVVLYDSSAKVLFLHCVKDIKVVAGGKVEERVAEGITVSAGADIKTTAGGNMEKSAGGAITHNAAEAFGVNAASISLAAASGGSMRCGGGVITMVGDFRLEGNLRVEGNLTVSGTIEDQKGDLTSHSHPKTAAR